MQAFTALKIQYLCHTFLPSSYTQKKDTGDSLLAIFCCGQRCSLDESNEILDTISVAVGFCRLRKAKVCLFQLLHAKNSEWSEIILLCSNGQDFLLTICS